MLLVLTALLGLSALGEAACSYYDKLAADEAGAQAHTNLAECLAVGACQRLPEKLRKLCETRQPAMVAKCAAGDLGGAHHEVVNARNAMEDHAGLLSAYRRGGQISLDLFMDNIGILVPDPVTLPSQSVARWHLWHVAEQLGQTQTGIADRALSILGALYRLEAAPTPCSEP